MSLCLKALFKNVANDISFLGHISKIRKDNLNNFDNSRTVRIFYSVPISRN